LCFNSPKATTSLYVIWTAMKVSMAATIPRLLDFWCGKTSINQLLLENKIVVNVLFEGPPICEVNRILIVFAANKDFFVISRYNCRAYCLWFALLYLIRTVHC